MNSSSSRQASFYDGIPTFIALFWKVAGFCASPTRLRLAGLRCMRTQVEDTRQGVSSSLQGGRGTPG